MKRFFMFLMALMMLFVLSSCRTTPKVVEKQKPLSIEEVEKKKRYILFMKNESTNLEVVFCIVPKSSMMNGVENLDKDKMCNVKLLPGQSSSVELPGFVHFALFAIVVDPSNGNILCHPQNGPLVNFKMIANGTFVFNDDGMIWRKSI